jgi:hypothetical protein
MDGSKLTPAQIAAMPKRTMDCVDCHNRPTHIYTPPDRAVDRALLTREIPRDLPYIKQQAVTALTKDSPTTPQALQSIETDINEYYRTTYPDVYKARKKDVDRSIAKLKEIFQTIRFPEMKVDWQTHPDNIGHFYSGGCFRCHDDKHLTRNGRKITKECKVCHDVLEQKEAGTVMIEAPDAAFQHPVDIGDLRDAACVDCHTGSSM